MFGYKEIDAAGLQALISKAPVLLVDVRTEAEVAQGMIEGATHIPLHLLPLRMHELDPLVPAVLYCRSGARSAQACAFLSARGLGNVCNLQGGIVAWVRSGQGLAAAA